MYNYINIIIYLYIKENFNNVISAYMNYRGFLFYFDYLNVHQWLGENGVFSEEKYWMG